MLSPACSTCWSSPSRRSWSAFAAVNLLFSSCNLSSTRPPRGPPAPAPDPCCEPVAAVPPPSCNASGCFALYSATAASLFCRFALSRSSSSSKYRNASSLSEARRSIELRMYSRPTASERRCAMAGSRCVTYKSIRRVPRRITGLTMPAIARPNASSIGVNVATPLPLWLVVPAGDASARAGVLPEVLSLTTLWPRSARPPFSARPSARTTRESSVWLVRFCSMVRRASWLARNMERIRAVGSSVAITVGS